MKIIFTMILALSIMGVYVWYTGRTSGKLEIYVFDTRGNPSIFIRTTDDKRILINGGANSGIIRYVTKVLPFYSRKIDVVILTNNDKNNASGLIDVVSRYDVGQMIVPYITNEDVSTSSSTDQAYEVLIGMLDQYQIQIKKVRRNDSVYFGKLNIRILFPDQDFEYTKSSSPEIIMNISYGDMSCLLLGDASKKVQKFIASTTLAMNDHVAKQRILVTPNSPSADILSIDLINAIRPTDVIYSQSLTSKNKSNNTDPLYMILNNHRFNVKQKSTVKVLSDGDVTEIK